VANDSERDATTVLSFGQERAAKGVFHAPCALVVDLEGALQLTLLAQALNDLVRGHDSLRTSITGSIGCVEPPSYVALPIVDASRLDDQSRVQKTEQHVRAELGHPFDPASAPHVRTSLLRLAADRHRLVLTLPSFAADRHSLNVLFHDLLALYSGSPHAPAPSHAAFARAQRERWTDSVAAAERQRTASAFSEAEAPLWPPVRGRASAGTAARALLSTRPELFRALGQGRGLDATLTAVSEVLLSRYFNRSLVSLGVRSTNRATSNERLVGALSTWIADSEVVHGTEPFSSLRDRAQRRQSDSRAEIALEESAQEIGRVTLSIERSLAVAEVKGLRFTATLASNAPPRSDLELVAQLGEQGLRLEARCLGAVLDTDSASRMLAHFDRLLESALSAPSTPVMRLQMLSGDESSQISGWNATDHALKRSGHVHELFAEQAAKTPEAIAVASGAERLTYRELDQRANQLARVLGKLGVGPETQVAICIDRSPALIVAELAVLKAGAGYLPLDPSHPRERLAFMIADAKAKVMLSVARLEAALPRVPAERFFLDRDWPRASSEPTTAPSIRVHPKSLAYTIYTSGSTGEPKGVMVEHGSLQNLVQWQQRAFEGGDRDRFTLLANVGFDASVWEIWCALTLGATLVVPDDETRVSPARLRDFMVAERINMTFVPTPLAPALLALDWPRQDRRLRILAGGDRLTVRPRPDQPWLYNGYGPTETCVFATCGRVASHGEAEGAPSIGRPLDNARIHILDADLNLVPAGAPGEVYIGGMGLGRGYLDRPTLTAERFVPDPIGGVPGARLYRTGDLARWLPNGEIEFLGRIDHQVKVRGFRVELGEIEAVLGRHARVAEAVVLACDDVEEKRLIAYVVPKGAAPAPAELRAHLLQSLPEHMVPPTFVVLDRLPLTENGKVNRRALPIPTAGTADDRSPGAHVSETQRILSRLWAEVLHVDRVSAEEHFFDLGGHSLSATRLVSRIRDTFHHDFALGSVLENPSLAEMAQTIERAAPTRGLAFTHRPVPEGRFPATHAQQRHWMIHHLGHMTSVANSLRMRGPLDSAALERAMVDLVRRQTSLRTTFTFADDGLFQVIGPAPARVLTVISLEGQPADQKERALKRLSDEEFAKPFDLEKGPLFRAHLLRLGPNEHVLLTCLDHILTDGWSQPVLHKDLARLYSAHATGTSPDLPPLSIDCADFAAWEKQASPSRVDYWTNALAGSPPLLQLPMAKKRSSRSAPKRGKRPFVIAPEPSRRVVELGRREDATPFMVLLAAFKALLSRYTQMTDIVVGTPVATREGSETEHLVGCFLNELVLRTDLSGEPSFRQLVARTRDVMRGAVAHRDVPFDRVINALKPERSGGHNPLYQMMFVVQNTDPVEIEMAGLDVEYRFLASEEPHLDLALEIFIGDEITGTFHYDAEMYSSDELDRLAGHFTRLVEGAIAAPDHPFEHIPLIDSIERTQQVERWNATARSYPSDGLVHEVFESVVDRTPDAIAAAYGDKKITYRELDERANRLAARLRKEGVKPEAAVGICLERSVETVVGLLAILKAGGFYVPLDPTFPKERLAVLCEDARARVAVAQERTLPVVPESTRIIAIDRDWPEITKESAARVQSGARSGNLAYAIYTSGSTGRPKGVAVTHRSILRLVLGTDYVQLEPSDRVAQASTSTFDAATFEIWGALLNGARIVGLEKNTMLSPKDLQSALEREQVTTLFLTTALFNRVVQDAPRAFAGLRTLLFGGEAVDASAVRRLLREGRPKRLLHVYGPTETTTFASWHLIEQVAEADTTVPIGLPLANDRLYVLDDAMEPVPLGVAGQLYIGGDGLARAYLGAPDLTAERFVPNPFSSGRLYKTGDLVRRLHSGTIEFVRRMDNQVKLRGFRIELGEIEGELLKHPGVRQTAVVVRELPTQERGLVAYFVAEGAAPAKDDLRAHLRRSLPEYMVPVVFAQLEAMPLTTNGKIDRDALPTVALESTPSAATGTLTATQQRIASAFSSVLGVKEVGPEDDFFTLGGHSILAVRLASRIEEEFGVDFGIVKIFENPTISSMAQAVEEMQVDPSQEGS
jgi:amino acid adenylation domain-containing protein